MTGWKRPPKRTLLGPPVSRCFSAFEEALPWGPNRAFSAHLDSACAPVHEPPGPKASLNTSLPPLCYTKEGSSFSHPRCIFPYPAVGDLPTLASATTQPIWGPIARRRHEGISRETSSLPMSMLHPKFIYVCVCVCSQLSIFVLFAFYNHRKQCLLVLFWYILFLSGAVYSFKHNKDDTKIAAACAEGWHLNCPEPSLFLLSPALMYRIVHPLHPW